MSHVPHELHEEFPDKVDRIHELKVENALGKVRSTREVIAACGMASAIAGNKRSRSAGTIPASHPAKPPAPNQES